MKLNLQEGEELLFEGKPENRIFLMWIFTKTIPVSLFVSFIVFYLLMFLWLFLVAMPTGRRNIPFPFHLLRTVVVMAPCWFVLLLIYYRNLKNTFHYYITNQRCVFEGGIIVSRLRSVPYHKVTDVEINQNIIERMIGLCSLKVFTPGTGSVGMPGFEKAEIIFYGLKDAQTPANIIQGIVRKYKATGE